MKKLYGLSKPYDFRRAFPFLAAIVFSVIVFAVMGEFAFFGRIHWATYRFYYFLYLGILALLGALLSFSPPVAWALIAISFIDFSLGLSTHSVLPADVRVDSMVRYQYHQLLQAVPTSNFAGSLPFWIRPRGAENVRHDSYGLRGAERNPDQLKRQTVIATLGGSTTYDIGVANGETWPEVLEEKLGPQYAVLNYGVPGYTTVENLIQTAFYLNAYGIKPKCAIYYEGWNDIRNAHLPHLDPGYVNFHLPTQVGALEVRRTPLIAKFSPMALTLVRYFQEFADTVPQPPDLNSMPYQQGSDPRLEDFFRAHLRAIAAINRDRGIQTIFVGQVLNRAKVKGIPKQWMPLVKGSDVWPLQEHFNAILNETAQAVGAPAFVPPIDKFTNDDFVDSGHFSPRGARKFAAMLAPVVRASCAASTANSGNAVPGQTQ